MKIHEIAALAPIGPHIDGLIRFSHAAASNDAPGQQAEFEILSRVHAEVPIPGEVPKMMTHPLSDKLTGVDSETGARRLLSEIPIRLMFDKPENNLSGSYKAFDRCTGQLLCCGNGETAAQRTESSEAPVSVKCAGPENCAFAAIPENSCQLHVRLKVQIEGNDDPLALTEFQSSGINSYRTLSAKLKMLQALYGGLRGLPLRLTSWAKSSKGSGYQPFYCANIELIEGVDLVTAKAQAKVYRDKYEGINFAEMETVVEAMQASSQFALDDSESVVTCWIPATEIMSQRSAANARACRTGSVTGAFANAVVSVVNRARDQATKPPEATTTPEEVARTIQATSEVIPTLVPTNNQDLTLQTECVFL